MIRNEFIELRKKLGLSQVEAALVLDVPLKTLQNWEQGRRKIKRRYVKDLELRYSYDRKNNAQLINEVG